MDKTLQYVFRQRRIINKKHTNTNATTINAVDREQKMWFIRDIPTIAQWYMLAKQAWLDIESVLPLKSTMRDLAENYNIMVENKWDQEDVQKAKDQLRQQLQQMMITPQQGVAQSLPSQNPQWQQTQAQPTM